MHDRILNGKIQLRLLTMKGENLVVPKVSDEYKENKRQELLASAMSCFAEKGYQAATIDDIVAHSGMSKGAVYNYFKSKEEIYLTLRDQATQRNFEKLKREIDNKSSAKEKLAQVFSIYSDIAYMDQSFLDRHCVQIEFYMNASRHEELNERMRENGKVFRGFLIDIVEEGKRTGEFREDVDGYLVAEAFWSFTDGMFLHLLVEKEQYPFKRLYETVGNMILSHIEKV
jgi:AcrR family transcriptional regulator